MSDDESVPQVANCLRVEVAASAFTATLRTHADDGVAFRESASVIGLGLNVPVVSKSAQGAATHFVCAPISPRWTCPRFERANVGLPRMASGSGDLVADIERPSYLTGSNEERTCLVLDSVDANGSPF